MRRFLVVVLMVVFGLTGLFSQKTEIINGYKVHHGERPPIDLAKVTREMYEPGKLLIKLAPGMDKSIKDDVLLVKTKDGYVKTGVQAVDAMNTKFQAEIYKPALFNFYKISPASVKYRDRHIAWGINLWMEVTLAPDVDIIEAVKQYSSLVEVDVAEPVYKKVITSLDQPNSSGDTPKWTPNDPDYSDQWHYNNTGQTGGVADCDIDLPEAWEIEKGNSDVIVAIIDQGVEYTHPDIAANMWSGIGPDGTSTNADYHGSHVAGTVAAVNNNGVGVSGVAGGSGSGDGVRIMTIDLFTPQTITTTLGMFTYAADNGASITQNSWGYGAAGNYVQGDMDGIDYFNANGGGSALNGGLTIFAAGNDDDNGDWWPGFYSEALSVAATSYDDDRAYYSNYGDWVHIAAPGGDYYDGASSGQVYSTTSFSNGSYMWMQGTSMACPHVSGVAALLVSNAYRNGVVLDPSDIWNLLVNNTDNIDAQNPAYIGLLGSGRLNANSSLLALQSMLPGGTPPAMPTLISPSDASSTSDATPTFDWSDVAGATSYTILVDDASNFSSPNINQSPTSSTYTPGTDLTTGTYYWKVLSTNSDGSSSYTTAWDFTITASVPMPGMPTLITPTDGSTVEDLTPTFDWSDASDATSYHIQIATKSNMTDLVVDADVAVSNYTSGSDMAEDIYYWKVLATNATGSSSYTGVWDVNVIAPPPPPGDLTLISPIDASDKFDKTPSFDWSDATDATGYEILVDNNIDFSSPEVNQSTGTSDYTQPTDLALDTYYWKARGTNSIGAGNYSGTWSFNVIAPPPEAPTLISPSNGSGTTDTTPTFDWSDAVDATSYSILVDNNSDYSSPEINQTIASSTYTDGTGFTAGTYYWKVLASNSSGPSSYTGSWSFTVQAPDVNLSTASISNTVAPEANVSDLFDIDNLGDADLNYSISKSYISQKGIITIESNDFESGLVYTNSGAVNWSVQPDLTVNSAKAIGSSNGISNAIITSGVFDGTQCTALTLDFDQILSVNSSRTPSFVVEYFNGSTWVEIYNETASTTASQSLPLPVLAANMQIRFTANISSKNGVDTWSVDNVVVSGPEVFLYTWLSIDSPSTGTVTASGSNAINITCDATGLAEATYNADITIASNDPDESSEVISVEFIVLQSTVIPAVPANIVTSISGTDLVVDWDVAADATGYDVYSSDDPFGTFTFAASVGINQYTVPASSAKLFYYIVATNGTK